MPMGLDKLKRDFARNKKKAAVLGALSVVMILFIIRAVVQLSPRNAEAIVTPIKSTTPLAPLTEEDETRLRNSKELWKTLRETRGIDAAAAFTFDPTYYNLDPMRVRPAQDLRVDPTPTPARPLVVTEEQRLALIKDQARSLVVRSTVIGTGSSRSVAIVNEKVLSVGDRIGEFEITAIRAREVEFKKDGVTLAVKMADESRGQ